MMKISNRKILALLMVMLMSGSGSVYAATSTANRPVVRVRRTNTTQNVRISRPVQVGNTSARNARVSSTTSHISSTGLRGDINGDGQVNSNDLALLKQYLNNSSVTINKADADMNNDGVINITDYNYLVQFLNPPQPILKGDVNGDGKVNEADYNLLNQFISGQKVSNFHHYNADMNNDKKFTTTDLSQLRSKVQVTPADTYTVFTIPNGWYEIAPLADGNMRLDVDDGREGNGVTIKLFTRNGHAAQRFLVNNVGNGYFTMRTGCNGYVDLEYGRTANGSRICQYEKEADNGKCQKFRAIRRNNEAAVYLEPILQPGLAITCANHSAAAETKVVIWSRENSNYQKWQFIKTNGVLLPVSVKEGLYSLQPMCAPNTELTVSGASKNLSTPVVISNQGSANQTTKSHQKWLVTSVGNGYYKITAENSGLALNNHNGANVNGNPISIYTYSGYCQEFRFYDAGNGYYIIQPKNVSGVLDVAGGGNTNNTRVQLYQYNGSAAQKWKLVSRQRGVDPDPYKQWDAYPKRTCNVYTNSALTKRTPGINEYVDTSDPVTVLGETSNAYYIRYKARSGYKDRWVTKDIFKEEEEPDKRAILNKLMNTIYLRDGAILACDFDGYTGSYKQNGYRHEGIDVRLYDGAPVYAVISGYVLQAGGDKLNTFSIKDSTNNKIVVYLHMKSVLKQYKGKYISKGTLIGYQGSAGTGSSHVHIEVTNGKYGKAEISMDTVLKNDNPYPYWKKVLF